MDHLSSPGHSTTAEIRVGSSEAFNFLQDPLNLGQWALGSWSTQATEEPALFQGTSLFSGEITFFSIKANAELNLIDYFVGERGSLKPRISVRVIAGENYGNNDSCCLVTLSAWRDTGMDDSRWQQLCICHETEILLLKALLERK